MPKFNLNYFYKHTELVITSLIIFLCLVLSFFFPIKNSVESITASIFFLIIFPALYIKIILKKNLIDYGLNLKNQKNGLIWGILMLFSTLLIFYLFFNYTAFGKEYSLSSFITGSFWKFLIYELIFVNFTCFIQEYFFRGFVFFSFFKKFSHWTILLQSALYIIILLFLGTFSWQLFPAIVISLTSGIIVLKSRSFIYSYAVALISIIILDSYLIYHLK